MKKIVVFFISFLVLCCMTGAVYLYITRDERAVRELVGKVVQLARREKSDLPHAGIFKYAKADDIFDENISISNEKPAFEKTLSRGDFKVILASILKRIQWMDVDVADVAVKISDGKSAEFSFDAEFTGSAGGKEDFSEIISVSGKAVKVDGKWLVLSLKGEPPVK